jgi:hypothetical protein
MLHHTDNGNRPSKAVRETEAEAVAFVVSQAVGLDTNTASSDYIQLHAGSKATLVASLDRIQLAATGIISAVLDHEVAAVAAAGQGSGGRRMRVPGAPKTGRRLRAAVAVCAAYGTRACDGLTTHE